MLQDDDVIEAAATIDGTGEVLDAAVA